jgi:hypothetical protein
MVEGTVRAVLERDGLSEDAILRSAVGRESDARAEA